MYRNIRNNGGGLPPRKSSGQILLYYNKLQKVETTGFFTVARMKDYEYKPLVREVAGYRFLSEVYTTIIRNMFEQYFKIPRSTVPVQFTCAPPCNGAMFMLTSSQ